MILTANIGSASKKYALFRDAKELLRAHFECEGSGWLVGWLTNGQETREVISIEQYENAAELVVSKVKTHGTLSAIAIRIVAHGTYFQEHRLIDDTFIATLTRAQEFAPLHITATLAEIKRLQELFPHTPLIAASDSAFHKTLPEVAATYALPRELIQQFGLRRFGYHGLSLQSVVKKLRSTDGSLPEKTIVCHLGSGCSVTALKNGVSIETSMGFSPLEGLIMSTRSGSVDPSVVVLLAEQLKITPRELEKKMNSESGLLAVGGSNDIRELLKREKKGDANAKLALDLFSYRVRQYIGSYAAVLGGVDALVFTGTVGERSAIMRERILTGLDFLKLKLATRVNNKLLGGSDGGINKPAAKAMILVLCADENTELAEVAQKIIS